MNIIRIMHHAWGGGEMQDLQVNLMTAKILS